jgi:hypothetical protein
VDAAARARYCEVGTIEPLFSWCCISIDDWPRLVRGFFSVTSMIDSLEGGSPLSSLMVAKDYRSARASQDSPKKNMLPATFSQ